MLYVDDIVMKGFDEYEKPLAKVKFYGSAEDAVADYPLTGETVDGLDNNIVLAPGSSVYNTGRIELHILSPLYTWDKQ